MIIKKLQQLKAKKGFTLVELLVVIAIIGILAAVLIPLMSAFLNNARISNAESTANQTATAIQTPLSAIMGRSSEEGKPQLAGTTPPGGAFFGVYTVVFDPAYTPGGLTGGSWRATRIANAGTDGQIGNWGPSSSPTAAAAGEAGKALIEDALNDSFPSDNVGVFLIRVARIPNTWESDSYVTVAFMPGATTAAELVGTAAGQAGLTAVASGGVANRNDPHFNPAVVVNGRVQGVRGRPIVGTFPPQ